MKLHRVPVIVVLLGSVYPVFSAIQDGMYSSANTHFYFLFTICVLDIGMISKSFISIIRWPIIHVVVSLGMSCYSFKSGDKEGVIAFLVVTLSLDILLYLYHRYGKKYFVGKE